jgi:hypothetical protein
MLVSVLDVCKSGTAFIWLETAFNTEKLKWMLSEVGLLQVIASEDNALFLAGPEIFELERNWD